MMKLCKQDLPLIMVVCDLLAAVRLVGRLRECSMSLMKQSYTGRGVALFFILFTFADLSVPQLCRGELGGCSLPSASLAGSNSQPDELSLSVASRQPQQQQSESSEHSDEDCFCCCSHIVPGSHFIVALLELKSPVTNQADHFLPTSSPSTPFHPPRLS